MTQAADFLVCFKEYPHTDILDRAYDLVDLCTAKAEGRIRPACAVYDCNMISIMHTSREPMRGFVDRLLAMEGKDGRSEEHTSELQSLMRISYAVFGLKKKTL